MENNALPTVGLLVIRNNKLLLAYSKNKKAWYLPGGKIDKGESAVNALQREIQEELNVTLNPQKLKYYCHISAPAYGEIPAVVMEQDCFLYEINEEIQAGNEIADVKLFNLEMYKKESVQVIGVLEVFEWLIKDKILS